MAIRQITPNEDIARYLESEMSRIETVIVNVLNRVGLLCVTEARNNGSYIDQTGNLRSSIGYAVLKNGIPFNTSNFESVKGGAEGSKEGVDFVKQLAGIYGTGLVLIVVAGMEYAAYVETKRNVLTSSEQLAKVLVPQLLGKLGFTRR